LLRGRVDFVRGLPRDGRGGVLDGCGDIVLRGGFWTCNVNGESSTHIKSRLRESDLAKSSDADSHLWTMHSFVVDSDAVLESSSGNCNLHHWIHDLDLQGLCHRLRCFLRMQNLYLSLMVSGNALPVEVSSTGSDFVGSLSLNRIRMPLLNRMYQDLRRPRLLPLLQKFLLSRNLLLEIVVMTE
jgi:hypothetical protein